MIIGNLKEGHLEDLANLIKEKKIQIQTVTLTNSNSKVLLDSLMKYSNLKTLQIDLNEVNDIESLKASGSLRTL